MGRRELIMWRKALPSVIVCGVLLVGCNNNTLPKNNETPMENIRDDARQWKNDVERDIEGRDYDNGNVNENRNTTGTNRNEDNIIDEEIRNDDNKNQVEIIEDFNRKNGVE